MASNAQTVPKLLRNLRDNGKIVLQCGALTYIRSNAEKLEMTSALSKEEYPEVCRLIMEISTGDDQNARNEATKALHSILKFFKRHDIKFFESALHINRGKRLKIFQFLETIDDSSLATAVNDPFTIDFIDDCLSSIQASSMVWLLQNFCTENLKMLEQVENKRLTDAEELEEIMVNNALVLLRRIYKTAMFGADSQRVEKFDLILFDKVVDLVYMGHRRQRGPAIRLLNQAIEANLAMRARTKYPEAYLRYKENIQGRYSARMMLLVRACESDWSSQWSVSIQLLGTDLHRGAPLINKLLSVEERAFKSTDTMVRREAFVSWKLLIDNLALDMKELATQRRVRLLCVPLTANNSKSELIALKKLEVWWYLITKLYPNIASFAEPVVTQFLNFCFGPLGDTPLLSTKVDVIASPGKRFYKAKIIAIDALLQLVVANQRDRQIFPGILEERLPGPVGEIIFKQYYKAFLHSVGEAVVIMSKLASGEFNNREEICKVLWINIMRYVRTTSNESKAGVYNELILVITELQTHSLKADFVNEFLRDVIIPELSAVANDLIYYDRTLMDLMTRIMSPEFLTNLRGKQCEAVKCLMWQTVRPETMTNYHPETLRFLETTLNQIRSIPVDADALTDSFELWFAYAEIAYKYMRALQDVNEGTAAETNFKTIESIISFPFTHMHRANSLQAQKIAVHWKDVYKKFECQADTISSVKPNEIFDNTSRMIEECLAKNEKCYRIAVHCLDAIMATINYKFLLAQNNIPTIVRLVGDLAAIALHEGQPAEAECALKALSSLLITVYGHSPEKVLSYMSATSQTIELMLKTDAESTLLKEITNTWETIVSILRGLSNLLDENFLQSYKQAILLSMRHVNPEISSQTRSILDLKDSVVKEKARLILVEFADEFARASGKDTTKMKAEKVERTPKSTRIAGSFLNRKAPSPRNAIGSVGRTKNEPDKKLGPLPPEPDSQDYIVIKSDAKLDVTRLTEHQKESFKRRRDDIPAMYNDLSQSSSRDTQDLQNWFVAKKKPDDPPESIESEKSTRNDETSTRNDETSTREVKIDAAVDTQVNINTNENRTIDPTIPRITNEKVSTIVEAHEIISSSAQDPTNDFANLAKSPKSNESGRFLDNETKELPDEKCRNESCPIAEETCIAETKLPDSALDDQASIGIAKKLNFESWEEFPETLDKNENEPSLSVDLSSIGRTNRGRRGGKASATRAKANNSTRTEHGTKRKAASDDDNEERNEREEKRRKKSSRSSSCTPEDNERSVTAAQTGKRTEIEMSRLRIDMISDGPLTSRRRSKYSEDFISSEILGKRSHSSERKSGSRGKALRSRASSSGSQRVLGATGFEDNGKKRRARIPKIEVNEKILPREDSDESQATKSLKSKRRQRKNVAEIGAASVSQTIIDDDDESMNEPAMPSRDDVTESAVCVKNNDELNAATNVTIATTEFATNRAEPTIETSTENDLDEIVESSQNSAVPGIGQRRSFGKIVRLKNLQDPKFTNDATPDNEQPIASSPIISSNNSPTTIDPRNDDDDADVKINNDVDPDETFLDISSIRVQLADDVPLEDTEKKVPEASKTTISPITSKSAEASVNFSSPRGQAKRYAKSRVYASSQGRAAHMLGLVTKAATIERDGQHEKSQADDDAVTSRRMRGRENDWSDGGTSAKRDRPSIVREPERIGSPSGSRQEKIFNNMKAADHASSSSPSVKLFGNLRNNGEKISPKMEKSQNSCGISVATIAKNDDNDDDNNVSLTKDTNDLPILEWSSANPPSLTASPSSGILKRNRLSMNNEPEMELNASNRISRKRVSFADPPVSREMSYEIECSGSPHKAVKICSTRGLLAARKDSPMRIKQTRFTMIQLDNERADESQSLVGEIDSTACTDELFTKIIHDNRAFSSNVRSENSVNRRVIVSAKSTAENEDANSTMDINARISLSTNGDSCESVKSVAIDESPTQDDLFNSSDEKIENSNGSCDRSILAEQRNDSSGQNSSVESCRLNVTDDSVLGSVKAASVNFENSAEQLEDTLDAADATSRLDLIGNSKEKFAVATTRKSNKRDIDSINETYAPTINESSITSLSDSQESQLSCQSTIELARPESLNSIDAIYPNLEDCQRPIDDIIDSLTNPLWRKNLMKYLDTRCIRTIGDLARLSEREIVRIPVKGSSKLDYVRKVLGKFELKLRETGASDGRKFDDFTGLERLDLCANDETTESRVDTEIDELPREIQKSLGDISVLNCVAKLPEDSAMLDETELIGSDPASIQDPERHSRRGLELPMDRSPMDASIENSISTIVNDPSAVRAVSGLLDDDTAIVSRENAMNLSNDTIPATSTRSVGTWTDREIETSNKSIETQARLDELLDEIDAGVVLQSAVKRTSAEVLLTEYKLKMEHMSKMELCKETLRVLGIDSDTLLKLACRESGLRKVLCELPNIFYDGQDSNC